MNYRLFFTIPLLFVSSLGFGQSSPKGDTLVIHLDTETYTKTRTINENSPRLEPRTRSYLIDKRNDEPLTGLYKVITGSNSFYYCRYDNGAEVNYGLNYIEYHQNGKLIQIDIKGVAIFGSKYLTVPNYSCGKKIKGFYKEVVSDAIVEEVIIKQKVKKGKIHWNVKAKHNVSFKGIFEKHRLKGCF
ncbi:hypothetical protein AAG747_22825 [Rapidithrix thailandica]|uniref:Uncharacterized protein n=1 Tax=Rapidithrix thailandica TaxID=413964 RepID=A0AAW9SHL3_9BACT